MTGFRKNQRNQLVMYHWLKMFIYKVSFSVFQWEKLDLLSIFFNWPNLPTSSPELFRKHQFKYVAGTYDGRSLCNTKSGNNSEDRFRYRYVLARNVKDVLYGNKRSFIHKRSAQDEQKKGNRKLLQQESIKINKHQQKN